MTSGGRGVKGGTVSPLLLALACHAPESPRPPLPAVLGAVLDGRATEAELAEWERMLADRAPHAGPQHERLFRGHTPDGFTFRLDDAVLLREHAAVPDAVIGPDGRTWLWFVEGDHERARALARARDPWMRTHGLIGFGAIDLLVGDGGPPFTSDPGFVVHRMVPGMVVDPTVRRLPDGRWRMYYVALRVDELLAPGAWDDGADHTVYTAVSTDLRTWTQEGPAVVGPNADPAVWCDGDWCLMVSTGLDRSTSTDGGRTFTFEGVFGTPAEGDRGVPGFAPAFLELPDGRVRLFYNSKDRGGALRSMVSTDRGRTWVHEPGDRVPPYTLEAPSFLPAPQGGWWVYYHYWAPGYGPDSWQDGYLRKEAAD